MNKLISIILFLIVTPACAEESFKDVIHNQIEAINKQFVQKWENVCKDSKCAADAYCGLFEYDSPDTVKYTPSPCEEVYLRQQQEIQKTWVDKEIRKRYGSGK